MRGTAARRLDRLSSPLAPERPPYYVRWPVPPGLERTFPAEGWYWVPAGHHVAVYLGANEIAASLALHRMINEQINGSDA